MTMTAGKTIARRCLGLPLLVAVWFAGDAQAHGPAEARFPVLDCALRGNTIACEARWSDGTAHPPARILVVDRQGRSLLAGSSRPGEGFHFAPPAEPWAVMLHSQVDGEQTVELPAHRLLPVLCAQAVAPCPGP